MADSNSACDSRVHKVCPHCRTEYGPDVLICPNDGARLSAESEPIDPLIGRVLADRYRIINVLGEGGMGRVYLAEHVRMHRRSAVKVMSPSLAPTPDALSRFNREAANASSINHPNVAAIYDFGETVDGTLYLAMEYVEGETLSSMLRRVGPLPLPVVADLTRQIADALNAAHQLGIVHRDLKPDNILVTRDAEGRDQIKVVDFGIAKTTRGGGQTVTTVGMSIGTPEFMSPEQLAGEPLDSRADIYSLGLVVFTMLTGEPPYPAVASKQSLVQRLTERPRTLAEVRPNASWPPRLQAALDCALSPEPADRYARVGEFAQELIAATGGATGAATGAAAERGARQAAETRPLTLVTPASAPTVRTAHPVATPSRGRAWFVAAGVILVASAGALAVLRPGTTRSAETTRKPEPAATKASAAQPGPQLVPGSALAGRLQKPSPGGHATRSTIPTETKRQTDSARSPGPPATLGANRSANIPVPSQVAAAPIVPTRGTDSAVVAPPPPGFGGGQRAGRHAYLDAAGDSMPRTQRDSLPIVMEARELFGHINRARKLTASQQVMRAGPELRTAFEEFFVFQAEHPYAPQTRNLRLQLSNVSRAALVACGNGSDTTSIRARRGNMCDGLQKAAAAIAQPPRGMVRPFGNDRRGGAAVPPPD